MPTPCTLYIVRHGQTEWNVQKIFIGQKDSPLTPQGIQQAEATRDALKNVHFDAIYSSDSGRAFNTAKIIKGPRTNEIITEKLLREKSGGSLEGTAEEKVIAAIMATGDIMNGRPFPDLETNSELGLRFIGIAQKIAAEHQGQTVLIVTHAGCIRNFLIKIGKFTPQQLIQGAIANAGYIQVSCDGTNFTIQNMVGVNPKL